MPKITIVYDDNKFHPDARVGFGFSCLISLPGNNILFDTGAHAPTLLYNLEHLNITIDKIGALVISHLDSDHVGGLSGFLEKHSGVHAFVPASSPAAFRELIQHHSLSMTAVRDPVKICPGATITGEMGQWVKEISLIVETSAGLVIIIGDAHPGLLEILENVKSQTGDAIFMAVGGFHLEELSIGELKETAGKIKEMGIREIAPVHSSGDNARKIFREEFGTGYIEAGVGKVINME